MLEIFIDPRARISYAAFYIYGLYELFGKKPVKFSIKYFEDLIQKNGLDDFDHYFAFVIVCNDKILKRIVIDYRDKNSLNYTALNWCDAYGKVNCNRQNAEFEKLPLTLQNKIIPVGPNFGIKIWSDFGSIQKLLTNYLRSGINLPVGFRTFLSGYNWQMKRMPFISYLEAPTESNYVFFISSFYLNKANNTFNTNQYRAAFIRACKNNRSINFEGGLFASDSHPEKADYNDVITNQYVQPKDYLNNLRRSAIVFNTPAIWGCHGWKLGEFLAMGKAIISTHLTNEMPYPFVHGRHVHFVDSEGEIDFAVQKIVNDKLYLKQLENGAKKYFEDYLAPRKVVERLIAY